MDPRKLGDDKLRRFFHAHSLPAGTPVRSILDNSRPNSLRHMIRSKMYAFVLPNGPISDPNVVCTHARLEVWADNEFHAHYELHVRIEARTPAPVLVAVGFNFYAGGRYMFGLPALNFSGGPRDTTIFSLGGPSHWLANNLVPAFDQGVNFRIHSTTDMDKKLREFALEFVRKLDGPKNKLMSFFDDDRDRDDTPHDVIIANFNSSDIFAESGLQPNLNYPVGLLVDEFFS
jgi:hypothetical protein